MKLLEVIKNTFINAYKNKEAVVKISSIWFLILVAEAFSGFGSYCVVSDMCTAENSTLLTSILYSLSTVSIVCAYIRHEILKTEVSYGQLVLGKKEVKFILFSLLFALLIILPSVAVVLLLDFSFALLGASSIGLTYALLIIVPIYFSTLFARLYIKFAAIAIGDVETTIKKSFALTKGNGVKLFLGQILTIIPTMIIYSLLVLIFLSINSEAIFAKIIFCLLLSALSFVDSAIKGSYYTQIYKNFVEVIKVEKVETVSVEVLAEPVKKASVAKKKPVAKKAEAKKSPAKKKATNKKLVVKKNST